MALRERRTLGLVNTKKEDDKYTTIYSSAHLSIRSGDQEHLSGKVFFANCAEISHGKVVYSKIVPILRIVTNA